MKIKGAANPKNRAPNGASAHHMSALPRRQRCRQGKCDVNVGFEMQS
jgi:hypothetical protein